VKFAHALLKRGVRVLERGAWFVSFAHDDAVIDTTLAAVKEAAREIAATDSGSEPIARD
jgi:glutamate-1-semialdehyde 2,1-aminomutase